MASDTPARSFKRILQACENCRRKKTRCPGEKPKCSNCTRLRQHCQYPGGDYTSDDSTPTAPRNVEDRLAQLEEKLDLILEKPARSPKQGETPHTFGEDRGTTSPLSPPAQMRRTSYSRLVPTNDVVTKAIDVYFLCSHRQPVWLFETRNQVSPNSPEEFILAILGLSTQYAPAEFSEVQLQPPASYNDAARSMIMLKVANSTVDLSTIQALCILAFSNFVAGDKQLACFHINMLGSLLQCSGLDRYLSSERTRALEEHRRAFWSFRALHALFGLQVQIAFPLDFRTPRYLTLDETLRQTNEQAPLLPQEYDREHDQHALGIWAHMVRSATLWEEVRQYIWRCAEGQTTAPWKADSGYTAINSHLLDMEGAFPQSCRYDSARFQERSTRELIEHRSFWLPWMKIQITYHTILSVLNHPFLYASRNKKPKPGPNAFWKQSTDMALLHSTWIARLIEMAKKKDLQLADPFFAHAAAIAVTLHLYWSRVSDSRIRTPAENNLAICRSFITDMASRWPVCQDLIKDVDSLVECASATEQSEYATRANISTHTSLMWSIMDFASPRRSRAPGQSLFHSSLENALRSRASSDDQTALEEPEVNSPPQDYQTSTGGYAPAPDWYSPLTQSPTYTHKQMHGVRPHTSVSQAETAANMPDQPQPLQQHAFQGSADWTGWRPDESGAVYDPWSQFYERSGPTPGWWDYGNL